MNEKKIVYWQPNDRSSNSPRSQLQACLGSLGCPEATVHIVLSTLISCAIYISKITVELQSFEHNVLSAYYMYMM